MTTTRPTFTALFIAAYWDLGRALRAHWRLAFLALVVILAGVLARSFLPRMATGIVAGQLILRHGLDIAATVLLAPFLLALHRFVLLGEVSDRYAFEPGRARFQSFCGWLVVLMLVASIPSLLYIAALSSGPIYYVVRPPAASMTPQLLLLAACIAVLVGFLRLIVLLPAVAVDAPGASWQYALDDTKGNFWFVGLACVLPLIPVAVVGVLMFPVARFVPFGRHAVWAVLILLFFALLAVVASRLYQVIGARLTKALHGR